MVNARPREHLAWSWIVIGLSIAIVLWIAFRESDRARAMVAREDVALAKLHAVLEAQRAYREANGRYGWLEDLTQAGLLAADETATVDGVTVLTSPGYRIDVLLPKRKTAEGNVRVGPPNVDRVNPRLVERHFVAVARPTDVGTTAFRIYYIDESGKELISESVSDETVRKYNPLPTVHLGVSQMIDPGGTMWIPLDYLETRDR